MRKLLIGLFLVCLGLTISLNPVVADSNSPHVAGVFGNNAGEYALLIVEYGSSLRIEQYSNNYATRHVYFDNVQIINRVVAVACGNYIYIATESDDAVQSYVAETVANWPCGQQYIVYMPLIIAE